MVRSERAQKQDQRSALRLLAEGESIGEFVSFPIENALSKRPGPSKRRGSDVADRLPKCQDKNTDGHAEPEPSPLLTVREPHHQREADEPANPLCTHVPDGGPHENLRRHPHHSEHLQRAVTQLL